MAGINHVRRWVMSQMTKKADDGIMITLPEPSKVDLNVNITMDRLLRNGIDPDAFTNPQQVENALNTIDNRMFNRAIPANSAEGREITEKLFGKQKAPVFDLEGNRIPEGSGIMGGKAVKDLMDSGQVTKGARGMKKSKKVEDREMFQKSNLNKTEAQLKAEMEASNKKGIENIKNKRQLTEDEIAELDEDIGGLEYTNDFDGTVGSANKLRKERADYIREMELEYKKGNLDPEPGSGTSQRKRFLQKKLEEAESSGDARLMSREEREELFDLDDIPEYAKGGVAGLLGERPGYRSAGFISGRTKSSKSKSSTSKGPAGGASAGGNYGGNKNPNQTYGGGNNNTGGGGGGGPPSTNTGGGGGGGPPSTNTGGGGTTTTSTTTQPNFKELIKQKQIIDRLKSLGLVDEEDLALSGASKVGKGIYSLIKPKPDKRGFNFGVDNFDILNPGKTDIYGNYFNKNFLTDSDFKLGLKQNLKEAVEGDINPQLQLERRLGNKNITGTLDKEGNFDLKFSMPFGNQPPKKVGPRNFEDRLSPDISKFNFEDMTGIPSQAPANNMQLAMMTGTQKGVIDAQGNMGKATGAFNPDDTFNAAKGVFNEETGTYSLDDKGEKNFFSKDRPAEPMTREEFDAYVKEKGYADGGRANFVGGGMGRRGFLKMLAGAGAGIAGLKSGLVNILGKGGTKEVAKEVVKQSAGTPPPYFFKLVDKIKTLGDDVTKKAATKDREVVTKYKDFELTEDVATGEQTIQRIKQSDFEYYDEQLAEDVYMNYKPGKGQADETTGKVMDEYVEDTSYIRTSGSQKGDIYDTVDGIPDDVLKEIEAGSGNVPESFYTGINAVKKADGGRIGFNDAGFVDEALTHYNKYLASRKARPPKKRYKEIPFTKFFEVFSKENRADGGRIGYQVGGDVSYDATDPIYGSSAATFTPNTVMDQFGNQVQAEMGNNFNKPLIPQVTDQAATNRRYTPPTEKESLTAGPVFPAGTGGLTDIPAAGGMGGLGETDMPIAGGINNQIGILPVMPPLEGGPSDSNMKIGKFPVGGGEVVGNYNDPLPQDQLMAGFAEWKRNNPDKVSMTGHAAMSYMTLPNGEPIDFSGGAQASNMAQYLESIGQPPMTRRENSSPIKRIGNPNAELKMALASGGIARMLGE